MEMTNNTSGYVLIESNGKEHEVRFEGFGIYEIVEALGHGVAAVSNSSGYPIEAVLEAIKTVADYDTNK